MIVIGTLLALSTLSIGFGAVAVAGGGRHSPEGPPRSRPVSTTGR
ncbi:hypothetical protein [Rhodococcus sp. SORGH_AS_0301]|nr:hypothetical protein [Rhodococcus sp. SORGH_AS_0301]MDQ1180681.1 hypothetical protein [Rhodococcus sp. SORGH_AS_0301]